MLSFSLRQWTSTESVPASKLETYRRDTHVAGNAVVRWADGGGLLLSSDISQPAHISPSQLRGGGGALLLSRAISQFTRRGSPRVRGIYGTERNEKISTDSQVAESATAVNEPVAQKQDGVRPTSEKSSQSSASKAATVTLHEELCGESLDLDYILDGGHVYNLFETSVEIETIEHQNKAYECEESSGISSQSSQTPIRARPARPRYTPPVILRAASSNDSHDSFRTSR